MTSIPVAIWRFFDKKFKRLSVKRERSFVEFLLHFWNVHEIENILRKQKSILA